MTFTWSDVWQWAQVSYQHHPILVLLMILSAVLIGTAILKWLADRY